MFQHLLLTFVSLPLLVVWLIYHGKNWARWCLLSFELLGFLFFRTAQRRLQARSKHELWFLYVQSIVETVAVLLLFVPRSNRWFKLVSKTQTLSKL